MQSVPDEATVLAALVRWAEARPDIHALILTSSRARPGGPVDVLSDYDLVVVTTDTAPYKQDDAWIRDYGEPMTRWGDQGEQLGIPTVFRSAIYADHVKIDYSFWPVELLQRITESSTLLEELNEGYRVVLDKDGAMANWPKPTYRAFIPKPPTEAEYCAVVEEFWWVASYIAKSLLRGEVVFARWVHTGDLRDGALRWMLEWRMEIEHGWNVRPGVKGRGFERLLPAPIWAEVAASYNEDDWVALWRTVALFRRVAREVANALGFHYQQRTDEQMTAYLREIEGMSPPNR